MKKRTSIVRFSPNTKYNLSTHNDKYLDKPIIDKYIASKKKVIKSFRESVVDIDKHLIEFYGIKLDTLKFIGSGSYGSVIDIGNRYVLKIIPLSIDEIYKKYQIEQKSPEYIIYRFMESEFIKSYEMGKVDIGPRVFGSFYYDIETFDSQFPILENIMTSKNFENLEKLERIFIQVIIMEKFDYDGYTYFKNFVSIYEKYEILKQMANLIYKQINEFNLYCVDIKTSNFVIKKEKNNKIIVRMIDFDNKFCFQDINKIIKTSNIHLSSKQLLYATLIIQLYYSAQQRIFFNMKFDKCNAYLCDALFNNKIFITFFGSDWKSYIKTLYNDENTLDQMFSLYTNKMGICMFIE